MTTAERHTEISEEFLQHSRAELAAGDLLQASEKAWGAVAHCINSISKQRGWPVGSHRKLIENARSLILSDGGGQETEMLLLRLVAVQTLHKNFYEELMSEDEVRETIANASELVSALRRLAARWRSP
ncbi:MAG: hypothetical protein F4110_08480 [Acidimicrobiaceae bacterium]|nr:hypothetical protein [Acidimicrobiaceae bacterium]MXZ98680.1 hypothetical protein [Acidimicrobiaceae bacterium]MYE75043.1 hypothetical protein [Acidimicrobiaceae bacterium]MYE96065.1 hypothetical protein [Acidimicrobiaceae bacterium]MYH43213.1 hypothetical protein [Acidimicrobiaceae bacterium]